MLGNVGSIMLGNVGGITPVQKITYTWVVFEVNVGKYSIH